MKLKRIIPSIVVVLVLAAIILGAILFYRSYTTNQKMDKFKNTVNTLIDLPLKYSTGSYTANYERLVEECNLCITNKDTVGADALTEHINELKRNIIAENKQIADYKTQLATFQNAVSLYVITGTNKTEYNRLLTNLETAIAKSDVNSCSNISKQMTTLLSKLKTTNEQDAADAEKKYKEEIDKIQKQLDEQKKENQKKKSGDTNIYVTPKTEPKPAPEPPTVIYVPDNSDFICPGSSDRYLTDSDLCYLSAKQLRLARNEIFARHGRKFETKDLKNYFESKSWYYGYISAEDFDDDWLSQLEKDNIEFIQKYEAKFK